MNLFQSESDKYTKEQLSAREAQRLAEYIAWGPVIFQVSRLMVKWGILEALRDSIEGLTLEELKTQTALSGYALKILLEASLSAGTVLINSHPLKTIFQHKACTDKLYADSFYKVQKNSYSSFEVICCRR